MPRGRSALAVVAQELVEERAEARPRGAALLLGPPARVLAPRAVCRRDGARGGAGPRWRRPDPALRGRHGGVDVQLEVRVPARALAHAGPHQRALVLAHLRLQLLEASRHLLPEGLAVGQVALAGARVASVLALHFRHPPSDARLRVLALDRYSDRVLDVSSRPGALHADVLVQLVREGELSSASGHHGTLPAQPEGWTDLASEDGEEEGERSQRSQWQHLAGDFLYDLNEKKKKEGES